jgi:hypothetical protein
LPAACDTRSYRAGGGAPGTALRGAARREAGGMEKRGEARGRREARRRGSGRRGARDKKGWPPETELSLVRCRPWPPVRG